MCQFGWAPYNLWQMVCAVSFWPRGAPECLVENNAEDRALITRTHYLKIMWSCLHCSHKTLVPCWSDSLWIRRLWEVEKLTGQAVWTIWRLELARGGQDQKRDGLTLLRFHTYRWHLHMWHLSASTSSSEKWAWWSQCLPHWRTAMRNRPINKCKILRNFYGTMNPGLKIL